MGKADAPRDLERSTGVITTSAMAAAEIKHTVEHADQRIKLVVHRRVVRRL
jgi:hypothetical protein